MLQEAPSKDAEKPNESPTKHLTEPAAHIPMEGSQPVENSPTEPQPQMTQAMQPADESIKPAVLLDTQDAPDSQNPSADPEPPENQAEPEVEETPLGQW